MTPERSERIGNVLVEEFYWAGELVVYVDHHLTREYFEEAVARVRKEQEKATP